MPYDLLHLRLSEMTQFGIALRKISAGAQSMEEVAGRVVNLLYDEFVGPSPQSKACALVRFFLATRYGGLDADLRAFGARLLDGHQLTPDTRCLTLLATQGEKPEWKCRKQSAGHQAIPLPSAPLHPCLALPCHGRNVPQCRHESQTGVAPHPGPAGLA